MSSFINTNTTNEEKKSSKFTKSKDEIGKITSTLGTGENAKNSLIYLTIKYAFGTGVVLSILIVANYWFFREKEKVPDFIGDIRTVWEVVIPVITLALGYAFGKAQK